MDAEDFRSVLIDRIGLKDSPLVDAFLAEHPRATIFHGIRWQRVLQDAYGHSCFYWIARRGGAVVGVFPVTIVRFPVLGTKAVAGAYQFYSGLPVAADEKIEEQLVRHAFKEARAIGVKYFEIRHHAPVEYLGALGFVALDSGLVTTEVSLVDLDETRVRPRHRRYLGLAERNGVSIVARDPMEGLLEFRRLYLIEGRALGSPRMGMRFFREQCRWLGDKCYVWTARTTESRCIGGLMTIEDGERAFARCGAYSIGDALRLQVGKALIWRAMQDAAARGCKSFDFGVSWVGDRGLIRFKEGWGGVTRPVFQYVHGALAGESGSGDLFTRYELVKRVWRRLPLPIVDRVGAQVFRWVC
ncbi:MAG: GNAT family N-acetyltransferase [Candidatus Dadabacteria bacterium]|nr:MAG: GNAT family N-acetyltransferase [Candidatus Dadabacteria bacterium]